MHSLTVNKNQDSLPQRHRGASLNKSGNLNCFIARQRSALPRLCLSLMRDDLSSSFIVHIIYEMEFQFFSQDFNDLLNSVVFCFVRGAVHSSPMMVMSCHILWDPTWRSSFRKPSRSTQPTVPPTNPSLSAVGDAWAVSSGPSYDTLLWLYWHLMKYLTFPRYK